MPRPTRIRTRRVLLPAAIALLGVVGVILIVSYDGRSLSYDGRSKTERVSDCLVAAGFDVHVSHDDGKEPLGGDEGLLGPLGDYQARPPSDSISVTRPGRFALYELAVITVEGGVADYAFNDISAKPARLIKGCVV